MAILLPRRGSGTAYQHSGLLQSFLRACQDPDAEAMDAFAQGVRLGYLNRMPRTPAIYNPKAKWRLRFEEMSSPSAGWSPSYKSARERSEFLQKKIEEDLACGRMLRMTYGAAKAKFGQILLLGSFGVKKEGPDKMRLIHDGSHHTLINHKIRARGHIPGPLVGDIAADL